ncbi:TraX protein [Peptococcaceae bacterium CEB3]|nr:TraX protein [Peptococcaceae bacterium CEB3]
MAVDALKLIGILSMLVDHVGFGFFPQYPILRILGRLAFPIFAYEVAEGYTRTRNIRRYKGRLFLCALAAQIPYTLFFGGHRGDTLFTLVFALLLIEALDKRRLLLAVGIAVLASVVPVDYGFVGVAMPVLFYLGRDNPVFLAISQGIAVILLAIRSNWPVDFAAYAGVLLVLWFREHPVSVRLNKWFFYAFYPVHLLMLVILRSAVG